MDKNRCTSCTPRPRVTFASWDLNLRNVDLATFIKRVKYGRFVVPVLNVYDAAA